MGFGGGWLKIWYLAFWCQTFRRLQLSVYKRHGRMCHFTFNIRNCSSCQWNSEYVDGGTVDLGACQSPRILIDEDAVRNRVSSVGGDDGLVKVCKFENAVLGHHLLSSLVPHPPHPIF